MGLLGPCGKHVEEAEDVTSMPRTLRSMPRRPRTLPSMPKSCQASLHILGSHIKRAMEAWWYTTPLTSQLIRQQIGGYFFDVGLLGPCGKHAEEAEDVAKHA